MMQVLKCVYLGIMIGVVIPILFGITVDLFILSPIRNAEIESGLSIYMSQVNNNKNIHYFLNKHHSCSREHYRIGVLV